MLLAFTIGMTATMALACLLPASYRSSGTVLIEQQEMPTDLVRSTVTSYADERVQVISKRVMTTATLLDIIKRYNLYPRDAARETREALLKRMREDIGLKMISADVIDPRSGHPTSATIAFEVSYTSRSADQAARVANELTTLYLNENLTNRAKLARDATDFLEGEGNRINAQILDLEGKLATFKDKNYSKLPDLMQVNMQLLDRNEEELRSEEARLSSLEQQRVFLQAQLTQLKPNSTVYSETGERIVSSSDRLKMLRSQLAAAKAKYAADYPDVVTLRGQWHGGGARREPRHHQRSASRTAADAIAAGRCAQALHGRTSGSDASRGHGEVSASRSRCGHRCRQERKRDAGDGFLGAAQRSATYGRRQSGLRADSGAAVEYRQRYRIAEYADRKAANLNSQL
jgi:uncharacterized protein involved in exopolysaccharide biosynthesis